MIVLTDVTGTITYIGEAEPYTLMADKRWKITRVNLLTSGATILYPDGVTTFTKSWTDRSTYAYTVS